MWEEKQGSWANAQTALSEHVLQESFPKRPVAFWDWTKAISLGFNGSRGGERTLVNRRG